MTGPAGVGAGGLRLCVLLASVGSLFTLVLAGLMPAAVATGAGTLLVVASGLSACAVAVTMGAAVPLNPPKCSAGS